MINEIVLIRTHFFNPRIKNLIKFLGGYFGENVYVVCPGRVLEKLDPSITGNFRRFIPLKESVVAEMGLPVPPRWEWACGDYALYRARAEVPDARHIWMIEYDVVINFDTASEFFSNFAGDPSDFLAFHYRQGDPSWHWYAAMQPIDGDVMRCLFPAVRVSAAALDHLLGRRRALRDTVAIDAWPNDEAFVATTLTTDGFTCRDIGDGVATETSLSWERPHSLQELKNKGPDGLIYHPVVAGPAYLKKARQFVTRHPERFGEIAATLSAECGDEEYEILRDRSLKPQPPKPAAVDEIAVRVVSAAVEGQPVRFAVAEPDDLIQSHHLGGRFYEWQELSIIARHFPAGGTFCDIGANVGNHTVYAGLFLSPARIVVFEPNPVAIRVLELNILLNGLERMVDSGHLGIGLGAALGHASMTTPERNLGGNTLDPDNPDGATEIRTGDACLAGMSVDFLKIDVEGMEVPVLEGLAETIGRCRPAIFIEVLDERADALSAWCEANGYETVETYRRYVTCKNLMLKPRD
jgi:FkbM family methyltransferase